MNSPNFSSHLPSPRQPTKDAATLGAGLRAEETDESLPVTIIKSSPETLSLPHLEEQQRLPNHKKFAATVVARWLPPYDTASPANTHDSNAIHDKLREELSLSPEQETQLSAALKNCHVFFEQLRSWPLYVDLKAQVIGRDFIHILEGRELKNFFRIAEDYPLREFGAQESILSYCKRVDGEFLGKPPTRGFQREEIFEELLRSGSMPDAYECALIYLVWRSGSLRNTGVKVACRTLESASPILGVLGLVQGYELGELALGLSTPLLGSFLLQHYACNAEPMVDAYLTSIAEQSLLIKTNRHLRPEHDAWKDERKARLLGMQFLGLLPARNANLSMNAKIAQDIAETRGALEHADKALHHACLARLEEYGLQEHFSHVKNLLHHPLFCELVHELWEEREGFRLEFQKHLALSLRKRFLGSCALEDSQ